MSDPAAADRAGRTDDGNRPAGPLSAAEVDGVLAEFRAWLEDAARSERQPSADISRPPAVDLFTLVGQFTALRHDVNLQTKATRAAVERLAGVEPEDATRPLLKALIEVHDALSLGAKQTARTVEQIEELSLSAVADSINADPPAAPSGFFARLFRKPARPQWTSAANKSAETVEAVRDRLSGVADGYALGLRRLDRVLSEQGLTPIDCVGRPFDPEAMEAVELADGPANTVVEEVRRGYRRNGKVFRTAQVKVAR